MKTDRRGQADKVKRAEQAAGLWPPQGVLGHLKFYKTVPCTSKQTLVLPYG